jgi:UDP-N-acetylmuramyl pentapeptide phosphotransferase/UDP-N-acetylglucosamine-1-phosphate transferase
VKEIRDLGLEGQIQKKGTPTMGGLIIIAAILNSNFANGHGWIMFM